MTREKIAAHPTATRNRRRIPWRRLGLTLREARAVERARRQLHAILPNGEIKSLILYGSKVYGTARPDSDIDLFLVYDEVTPEQEASLKDLPSELFSQEPTVHLIEYRAEKMARENGISPLVYNVSHHGILIEGAPVPKLEINRLQVAETLIAKAKEKLRISQIVLAASGYNDAISDAYYAVLYAADAALATKGFVAQSHTGTETLVGMHFIRKGLISSEFKGLLRRAREARIQADYDREADFTRDEAEYWLGRARQFVSAVESSLPRWLEK